MTVRHAVRRLIHDWPFTAAAILILGIGIGANAAIFSVVNAVLIREQPLAEPERLVDLYQRNSNAGALDGNSYPAYLDMAEQTSVFAATLAASVPLPLSYRDEGPLRTALVEHTTHTYLTVLGLRPTLGRWFAAAEDVAGAQVVAVVSHRSWIEKFGANPAVLGRTIRIEGVPTTIVGVGPAGHHGTLNLGIVTDFWVPISAVPAFGGPPRALSRKPEEAGFTVKARLHDGVTVAQAQAAMDNLGKRLAAEYPKEDPGAGIRVLRSSDVRIHPQMDPLVVGFATVVLAVVGFVLAIACSNLATLLLVRGASKAKEVSIRLAMGATRAQLVGDLLTESLLLSLAGGAAGVVIAWWAIRAFTAVDLPIVVHLSLDYRVLIFAIVLSVVTGVLFGLAPALKATRVDLVPTLRGDGEVLSSGRRWFTVKNALVVFQVAVSVVLLGATSIFLQLVSASRMQDVGYAVDGVAIIQTDVRYAGYSPARAAGMFEELRRRVAALPGVEAAVLGRGVPMQTAGTRVIIEGAGADAVPGGDAIWAGTGYFDALQIPLLHGRVFDERDRFGTPRVAVITESMARHYFGAVNAVGRRFRFEQDTAWVEVIGIVADTGTADLQGDLVSPTPRLIYRSFVQSGLTPTTVIARTSLDDAALVGAMQRELNNVDPALPVIAATTMTEFLEDSLLAPKAVATFLGALGLLGLTLAGIGLYAVIAFAVSRRSREIGIRMALGARSRQVVWSVGRDVGVLIGAGTGLGLLLSALMIVALRSIVAPAPGITLYRPTPDPLAFLAIAALMAAVGVAAGLFPARRAATMNPLLAIRRD